MIRAMKIEPLAGVVVVELPESDSNVPMGEKPHDSLTFGKVISIHPDDSEKWKYIMYTTAHFRKYKDDARIRGVDRKLCFIEIKDILGITYKE